MDLLLLEFDILFENVGKCKALQIKLTFQSKLDIVQTEAPIRLLPILQPAELLDNLLDDDPCLFFSQSFLVS